MEMEQNNEIELGQALKEGYSLRIEGVRKVAVCSFMFIWRVESG